MPARNVWDVASLVVVFCIVLAVAGSLKACAPLSDWHRLGELERRVDALEAVTQPDAAATPPSRPLPPTPEGAPPPCFESR